jgi:dihydrofolate reductase
MVRSRISIIAALNRNRAIGRAGKLISKLPADLARFKKLTVGHPVIMGRKTFESIGRALPDRINIIITRDKKYRREGTIVVHSLNDAIAKAAEKENNEIFIIGGGEIYREAMPITDRLYLTLIENSETGDTFFPEYPEFKKIIAEKKVASNPPFSFLTLEK